MDTQTYSRITYGLAYVFATAILILSYLNATDVIPTFTAIALALLVAAGWKNAGKEHKNSTA